MPGQGNQSNTRLAQTNEAQNDDDSGSKRVPGNSEIPFNVK